MKYTHVYKLKEYSNRSVHEMAIIALINKCKYRYPNIYCNFVTKNIQFSLSIPARTEKICNISEIYFFGGTLNNK